LSKLRKPRAGSQSHTVDMLTALKRGGVGALLAAEELTRADGQIHIRVSAARKRLYEAAAKRAGSKSLSAWLLSLADEATRP
jgi:hypothetical protein